MIKLVKSVKALVIVTGEFRFRYSLATILYILELLKMKSIVQNVLEFWMKDLYCKCVRLFY